MIRIRSVFALLALATALTFMAADVQARVGGGSSGGSRGSRTFSAPPATSTAPNSAAPIQRTITQPGRPAAVGQAAGAAARPGFFGSGLLGGLAAGFIGAGLFGMLFGHGMFSNMGGLASILGLVLQVGLVVIVARLAWAWWQRRQTPAFAGPAAPVAHQYEAAGSGFGANAPDSAPLTIDKADYDAFETLLGDIQAAYSAENISALRAKVTPEMLSYFSEDLTANTSRGLVNQISDVKLLQGDLAEAWHEDDSDYATVAMRFSLIDRMVERASGRVVEGDGGPQEAKELWTFRRARGGDWLVSAIQQA
jgi:predicted lipid-binding transport protein (Tim44 family)